MNHAFHLPKIETRVKEINGTPTYVIKGYATVPNHIYSYKKTDNRTFKEYFSNKCIENLKSKFKSEKVFVDAEHIHPTKQSSLHILEKLGKDKGLDVSEQMEHIKTRLKFSELPMFKIQEFEIDDKGLFVEIRANPFYRDIDSEHKSYFDSVWGSLETGFINGISLNFKPTETVKVNETLTQIDNIDLYGISLTGSAANDMATITEVAMRSIEYLRGEKKCQKKVMRKRLMM